MASWGWHERAEASAETMRPCVSEAGDGKVPYLLGKYAYVSLYSDPALFSSSASVALSMAMKVRRPDLQARPAQTAGNWSAYALPRNSDSAVAVGCFRNV